MTCAISWRSGLVIARLREGGGREGGRGGREGGRGGREGGRGGR